MIAHRCYVAVGYEGGNLRDEDVSRVAVRMDVDVEVEQGKKVEQLSR